MTRSQDAAPEFIPASSTTAAPPAPATTRRTTRTPPATSASRTRLLEHPFRDPGIGEVAEEHNLTVSDPEDLDGRRGERLARRGDGRRCPHFHDHDLWVLGLVELRYLNSARSSAERRDADATERQGRARPDAGNPALLGRGGGGRTADPALR